MHSSSNRSLASVLAIALLALGAPIAAQVPADAVFQGFEPNGDFALEIDGEAVPAAEIFYAERAQAYLLLGRQLNGPVLVSLRDSTVQRVHLMKVVRRDDGTVDILADADLRPVGRYQVAEQAVTFALDGKTVALKSKPPLLGPATRSDLVAYSPGYGRSASAYQPDGDALAALRDAAGKDVRVRTYFGSWCSVCKRHVPSMMRLDKELAESGIAFEYYGLPKPTADPAEEWPDGVKGVPTAVVYVGGREVGRVTLQQWRAPEIAVRRLVSSAGS